MCKNGHSLKEEGSKTKKGACRICNKKNNAARYAKNALAIKMKRYHTESVVYNGDNNGTIAS